MKNNLNNALVKKAEEVARRADYILQQTNDWQMIKAFLSNHAIEIELTEIQQKKLERYQFIYSQLSSGKYVDQQVVDMTMRQFNIKISQAYEDLTSAKEIFATTLNINKRFELMLQLQINRKMLNKAAELDDMKAYAALEKNRALLLAKLPDEEESPGEFFEGHKYEMTFDPALLGAPPVDMKKILDAINKKRGKKFNTDMFEEAEVVNDHEENTLQ